MPQIAYEITCSAAPLQIEGALGSVRFCFRARHDEWSFLATEQPGVDPCDLPDNNSSARSGKHRNASYMSPECGLRIIRECLSGYSRGG